MPLPPQRASTVASSSNAVSSCASLLLCPVTLLLWACPVVGICSCLLLSALVYSRLLFLHASILVYSCRRASLTHSRKHMTPPTTRLPTTTFDKSNTTFSTKLNINTTIRNRERVRCVEAREARVCVGEREGRVCVGERG